LDKTFPLSVFDVVASGYCQHLGFYKAIPTPLQDRVMEALEQVGLSDCATRSLHTLSGGQVQRVLFARACIQDGDMIFLDEPFTAIDSYTLDVLLQILNLWHQQGKTILVVCHDLDLVESTFPETILLAQRILAWGDTKQVITKENLKLAKSIAYDLEHQEVNRA
jgi:zinc/manganese transport system ATP-binding protein